MMVFAINRDKGVLKFTGFSYQEHGVSLEGLLLEVAEYIQKRSYELKGVGMW